MYWKYQYYLPCSFLSTGETVMNKIVKKSLPPWSVYSLYANHHAATWKNGPKVKLYLQNYNIQLRIVNEVKWSEVAQSCPTLCDPMDCSLPGSSVHGIFQAIVLEWIAISFSRGSSRPRDRTQVSCIIGTHFTVWSTSATLLFSILFLMLYLALGSLLSVQNTLLWTNRTKQTNKNDITRRKD